MFVRNLLLLGLALSIAGPSVAQPAPYRTEVMYLSGTDNQNTVTWEFLCTGGRKSGYWTSIEVPSHWEQQGFGGYNYGRDYFTYGKNFRFENEKGLYRYEFTVPQRWKNKIVRIVFEGSMTDTEVKVNGQQAGEIHRGAFYRFAYDITDKIQFGKSNLLEVTVSKMSEDASVNNAERLADYWIFGGIYRPVYLEALPKQHIAWMAVDARADGLFSMNVHLNQVAPDVKVIAEIFDADAKLVSTTEPVSRNDSILHFKTRIDSPLLWTAETPNLYCVRVSLKKGKNIIHQVEDKFGFRTIEIRRSDGIYLNGTKIKMKGVNRHVWWPETGRCVSPSIDLLDVKLIKEMNMNAVRCSHYPPDKSFLRICDSLGLYVLNELAGWQKAYRTEVGRKLVREMVMRDVNHPSIIFWSNGNEGGHNMELVDEYAKYDLSKRPVIRAHHRPGNHFNGIDCNHYEDYYSTKKILSDSLIYMPTEFLHAQDDGGAAAALDDFWELHWNEKKGAGGFLWALLDEGLVRTDYEGVIDVNGVNAPDGILGPHREKEGSFYAIREIYSPVKIKMKELPEDFNGVIPVENRYHFTNLDQCSFKWSLVKFGTPFNTSTPVDTMARTSLKGPSIPPVTSGSLRLSLPDNWRAADVLTLTAFDPSGAMVYTWVWKIRSNVKILEEILHGQDLSGPVETTETDSTFSMKANGITVVIDKKTGMLSQLANDYSARLSFRNGPLPVQGTAVLKSISAYPNGNTHCVEANFSGDLTRVKWTMLPSGWLELEYEYQLDGTYPFAGVTFSYPENFMLGVKWLGQGPYRVWKNRMQGVTWNIWSKKNNATHTGSAPWHYPEFKGYHANVTWMEFDTVEGKFTVVSKGENLFVRLFDFYALSGRRPHPQLPPGDISFLDCIPPVGTKLALNINTNTSSLGPSSEPAVIHGTTKRTLYFYFGNPNTISN